MMLNLIPITLIGISHKTAPVEIREQAALDRSQQEEAVQLIIKQFNLTGCMILSTCNRTEIYLSGEENGNALSGVKNWLNRYKKCTYFSDQDLTYTKQGIDAVRHFFAVASGLDSQIIGEPQITGQVKESYDLAHDLNTTDTLINKMFTFALQAEKKVRSETFLSDGAVSVSFAGVELARKIFSSLKRKDVLLVGAGETAELAATHFIEKGVRNIRIANRTLGKAQDLAKKFDGEAYSLENIAGALEKSDIVISATASRKYVLNTDIIEKIAKKRNHEPIFFIDLAIPRDIDPDIQEIDGVYLYNLDNLNDIVQMNLEKRREEIPEAFQIIDEHLALFRKWLSTHSIASVINRLREHFDKLRKNELNRLKNRLPEEGYPEVEYLTQSIMNKLMHRHIKMLKKNVGNADRYQESIDFFNQLYGINEE